MLKKISICGLYSLIGLFLGLVFGQLLFGGNIYVNPHATFLDKFFSVTIGAGCVFILGSALSAVLMFLFRVIPNSITRKILIPTIPLVIVLLPYGISMMQGRVIFFSEDMFILLFTAGGVHHRPPKYESP